MTQSSEYPITARSYAFPRAALAGRHSASNMTQSIVIQGAAVGYAWTYQLVCTFGTHSYGALRIHCQSAYYSDPAHILICKLPPSSLAPSLSRTIYCVCIYITVGQCGNQASHSELTVTTTDCVNEATGELARCADGVCMCSPCLCVADWMPVLGPCTKGAFPAQQGMMLIQFTLLRIFQAPVLTAVLFSTHQGGVYDEPISCFFRNVDVR